MKHPRHPLFSASPLKIALIGGLIAGLAALGGCTTDTAASGPSVGGVKDATTSQDATLADDTGEDDTGATSDAGGLKDGSGGVCGDGACDLLESPETCPLDCKSGGGGSIKQCLASGCKTELEACGQSKTCSGFLTCATACSSLQCMQACVQQAAPLDQATKQVAQCGAKKTCFTQPTVCGNGKCEKGETATSCKKDCGGSVCGDQVCAKDETHDSCPQDCKSSGPVCGNGQCEKGESPFNCKVDCALPSYCGNGKCEPGETTQTCPKDCGGGGTDPITCAKQKCPTQLSACLQEPACAKFMQCLSGCKSGDNGCYQSCFQQTGGQIPKAFKPLSDCAQDACGGGGGGAKCGNGQCEPGESSQSCPQDCKPPAPVCGDGTCSEPFENSFSCPKDCKQTKPPVCGNGKCEPGETQSSCAKDCGATQVLTCAKKSCSTQYKKCSGSTSCNKALVCMEQCSTSQCLQQCSTKAAGDFQTFLGLAQCAQQAGCLSGGGGGAQCGNGKCEPGESSQSCPKDCKTSAAGSCKGACGGQAPGGGCWCDKACTQQGDCCADKQLYCPTTGAKCGDGKCDQGEKQTCPVDCFGPPPSKCGNGKCEKPFESAQSCPKDCSSTPPKPVCGNGICEAPLESAQSCPKDCSTTPPKPVCGNGICEAPLETSQSCPKDCGQVLKPCKSKSDCTDAEVCCGKPQGPVCVPAGQCF